MAVLRSDRLCRSCCEEAGKAAGWEIGTEGHAAVDVLPRGDDALVQHQLGFLGQDIADSTPHPLRVHFVRLRGQHQGCRRYLAIFIEEARQSGLDYRGERSGPAETIGVGAVQRVADVPLYRGTDVANQVQGRHGQTPCFEGVVNGGRVPTFIDFGENFAE